MNLPTELQQRIERLYQRLRDGRVLPFVGAGISLQARIECEPDFQPTLAWMKGRLVEPLREELQLLAREQNGRCRPSPERCARMESKRERCDGLPLLLGVVCGEDKVCTQLQRTLHGAVELFRSGNEKQRAVVEQILDTVAFRGQGPCPDVEFWQDDREGLTEAAACCCPPDCVPFDRIAEVAGWLWGHERVCELLRIESFARLEPLPAHRYLAYLAREGLVTEIISTNYDCCIETAFRRSFGPGYHLPDEDAPLAVIRHLNEYREHGGRSFTSTHPHRPILHLYKINGCAQQYIDTLKAADTLKDSGRSCDPEIAERIVLTERQLQTFRSEHWARDLFRDRSRTRALLLCGFGSEEPQVRHTALRLTEEFQAAAVPGAGTTPEKVAALPNAPFVAAYDLPSFSQVQVLAAFMWAHLDGGGVARHLDGLHRACLNAFCAADAKHLDANASRLSADLFLYHLYLLGFRCLFERKIEDHGAFVKWLEYHGVRARRWRGYLRRALYPQDRGSQEPEDRLFGTLRQFLQVDPREPRAPLPLQQWLGVMQRPTEPSQQQDAYLPLAEDSLLVLTTLLLLFALTGTGDRGQDAGELGRRVQVRKGLGLEVRTIGRSKDWLSQEGGTRATNGPEPSQEQANSKQQGMIVYLVSETSGEMDLEPQRGADDAAAAAIEPGPLVRRLAVPSLRHLESEQRRRVVGGETSGVRSLRPGLILTVAAVDLIRAARGPEDMPQALAWIFAAYRPEPRARLSRLPATQGR